MNDVSYETYWEQLQGSSSLHPANRIRYSNIEKILSEFASANLLSGDAAIVDVGCGDGSLLKLLRRLMPDARACGFDISQTAILGNKGKFADVHFVVADAGTDFRLNNEVSSFEGKFDVVVSSEVIEHVEDDFIFVRNLTFLAKPGGLILITTQSGPRYQMDNEILGHLRHYPPDALHHLLNRFGLSEISVSRSGFPWLNIQKKLVDVFFKQIRGSIQKQPDLNLVKKLILKVLFFIYRLSIPGCGPQLTATARKVLL